MRQQDKPVAVVSASRCSTGVGLSLNSSNFCAGNRPERHIVNTTAVTITKMKMKMITIIMITIGVWVVYLFLGRRKHEVVLGVGQAHHHALHPVLAPS